LSLQLRLFDLRHWRGKTAKSKTSPKSAQFEVIGDPNTSRNVQTTTWTSLKAVLYISPPHKDLSPFVQVIQAWSFGWLFIVSVKTSNWIIKSQWKLQMSKSDGFQAK
jgi:hypothetical protein